MRIGIDARLYGPQNRGLGRYIQKLIENLEKIDQENQYIIFLRKANWNDYQPKNPNFKKVLADYREYSLKEQIFMPWKIWRQKLDLIHFPHYNVPILIPRGPDGRRGATRLQFIVTIHDLATLCFPNQKATTLNPFLYKIKLLAYRLVIWLAVKRAKKIISVSEFSKKELIKYFKINPEKIIVTYEGVDETLKHENIKTLKQKNKLQQVTISYNQLQQVTSPYLLYVGAAYPHKNLENLLRAFYNLQPTTYNLVLVGEEDYFYQRLKKMIKELSFNVKPEIASSILPLVRSPRNDIEKKVIFAGYLDDEKLNQIYQNALLYIFPSYYEGFGLPGLEAMAQGVPVVASKTASLPEILGSAALYFDPHNVEDIAQVINRVINNKSLREDMIKKGFEQLKKFSWEKCAKETLEIYLP